MSAITAIFDTRIRLSASRREAMLRDMMAANYRHTPQDGFWQDAALGIAIGSKPYVDSTERYALSFDGEIYNRDTLAAELDGLGARFRDGSDADLFLQSVVQYGFAESLKRVNGSFAAIIWDRAEKTLSLVRDRLGTKPLYVGWAGDMVLASSELKSFKSCPEFAVRVSQEALAQYLRSGFVPAPYSIFETVWQIPAGCFLTIQADRLLPFEDLSRHIRPYWLLVEEVESQKELRADPMSDAEALRQFDSLLRETIAERLDNHKGQVGVLLSGGINSTLVSAVMQAVSPAKIRSFSLSYTDPRFNEAGHAAEIARHLGTDHKTLTVDEQAALKAVTRMADIYDEPFADSSQIPAYLLAQEAGKYIGVGITGDGGDEVFGGYRRHMAAGDAARSVRYLPPSLKRASAGGLTRLQKLFNDQPFKAPWRNARLDELIRSLQADSQFDTFLRRTAHWQPSFLPLRADIQANLPTARLVEQMDAISELEKSVLHDTMFYLPNAVLVRNERTASFGGLNVRSPLLDPKMVSFAWRLPEDMKFRDGRSKWLLDQMLGRYVPRPFFDRPKRAYSVAVNGWLRGPLRSWAENQLSEYALAKDGMLDPAPIRTLWEQHQKGRVNHGQALWNILMYQAWKEKWLG